MRKIKVLLVDDSAVVRQVVLALLEREPDIQVIGTASDPLFAMDKMARQWPDVIPLDVEMPRMDGITFLRKIMAERPTPVVICSSLTEKGAETTLQALAAGAVEIISKPKIGLQSFLQDSAAELLAAIRAAAQANLNHRLNHAASATPVPPNCMPMPFCRQATGRRWHKPPSASSPSAPPPAARRHWKSC